MKVSTMRLVDRWLGVPLCAILTLHRKVLAGIRAERPPQIRRILFVKLAEQGATVLAYPALRRAIQMVGRENVYFMVFQENRFILDAMEVVPPENIIAINTRGLFAVIVGTLRAILQTRRLRIDAAVDFEFFARSSAILTYLSGARRRAGFHSYFGEAAYRGDLMTHRLNFNPHLHTSQTFLAMVEALNEKEGNFPAHNLSPPALLQDVPSFHASEQEIDEVRSLLRQVTGKDALPPLILLNANAGDLLPLRRWPEARYVELARRLMEKFPELYIGFTGAPEEARATISLAQAVASPRCINLAGKTTLRQLLILYSLSEVLVTNDSGPAHFATLTPIDVVVLFGPETPALFAARTPRTHVMWSNLVCSPCVNAYNDRRSACRDNICVQKISVDQVFAEVCNIYESRKAQPISQQLQRHSNSLKSQDS